MTTLWDPITVSSMQLSHRLALSPMTRSRAQEDGTPGPLAAEYYRQRASLGLLITEGTQPSPDGQGYLDTPGIYTPAHVEGWRGVADAVHDAGAHLFIQLMHVGRMSHPDNTPHHRQPVAPSAIAPDARMHTMAGNKTIPVPRALSVDEIAATVDDFRRAAAAAVAAGADGVEVHGANGYLLQQFLAANANTRTDQYGGSIENRARLTIEVARAVADEIGASRTGLRISPNGPLGGLDEGPEGPDLYRYLVGELAPLGLAYLNVFSFAGPSSEQLLRDIRATWPGVLLLIRAGRKVTTGSAGGGDGAGADTGADLARDIEDGLADIVPLGSSALANPDVVLRLRTGAKLNQPDPATFYGGGAAGYVDYPTLATS